MKAPHVASGYVPAEDELDPPTVRVRVDTIRPGHVIVVQRHYPAVVVRVTHPRNATHDTVRFQLRYRWQATGEPAWPSGDYRPTAYIRRAVD